MTTTLTREQQLVDEQNRIWIRMQEIMQRAESDEGLTAEDRQAYDQAEQDLDRVSGDIERIQRYNQLATIDRGQHIDVGATPAEQRNAELSAEERYAEAFDVYTRRGMNAMTHEQQQLLLEADQRALGTTPDNLGGYLVPEGYRNTLVESMVAFGGILNLAEVITTTTGNDLPWPTSNEVGTKGRIISENTQMNTGNINFGGRKLVAHTYTSDIVLVPLQLLQDSAFNLEAWLPAKLGERIGRAAAQHFATGTGTGQPEGLTTNLTAGATGTGTTAITYDDLIDLEHSINSAYRPAARFVFADATLKVLRKLKDADGRPLWQPVPVPGMPATINGVPYTVDDEMPVPGAGAKSIVYGDIRRAYVVRRVLDVQQIRFAERYMDYLQVGFASFARMDGRLNDAQAARAFQHGS
ncbi:phage major capsid protein [Nocardiopsis dassonvillei]|uniref:phage major capsid protein n=1 Tax=Nocardiopsis dassonvillei TaxID=2014 RepID=UPI0036285FB4